MHEYFVQDREILHVLDNLGKASKIVSTTSLTAQTINSSEIFVCVSSERHQRNKYYLITCVSIRRHQCLFVTCYMLCANKMLVYYVHLIYV